MDVIAKQKAAEREKRAEMKAEKGGKKEEPSNDGGAEPTQGTKSGGDK